MTASTVTLDQVENMAAQLPLKQQLQLVAHLTERISTLLPSATPLAENEDELRRQRENEADDILAQCDAAAEMWDKEVDPAEIVRQMRAERMEQLCKSKQ